MGNETDKIKVPRPKSGEQDGSGFVEFTPGGKDEKEAIETLEEDLKQVSLKEGYYSKVGKIIATNSGKSPENMYDLVKFTVEFFTEKGEKGISFLEFVKKSQVLLGGIGELLDKLEDRKNRKDRKDRSENIKGLIEKVDNACASAVLVDQKGIELVLGEKEKVEFVEEFYGKKNDKIDKERANIKVYLHPVFNEISHPKLIAYEVLRLLTAEERLACYGKNGELDPLALVCTYRICDF